MPNSVALVPLAEFAAAGGKVELPEGAQRVAVTATAEETDEQILSLKGSDAVMMLLDVKPNLRVQVRGLGGSVGVTNAWEWGSVLCVLCVGWRDGERAAQWCIVAHGSLEPAQKKTTAQGSHLLESEGAHRCAPAME